MDGLNTIDVVPIMTTLPIYSATRRAERGNSWGERDLHKVTITRLSAIRRQLPPSSGGGRGGQGGMEQRERINSLQVAIY